MSGAGGGSSDSLTRTTLDIGGTPSRASIAGAIYALRHVPGVLLADVSSGGAAVVVAHDGAVPISALVSAANSAGVAASVSGGAAALPAQQPQHSRRLVLAMSTIAVAFVFAAMLLPDPAQRSLTMNVLVIAVWIWYFAGVFLRRKT